MAGTITEKADGRQGAGVQLRAAVSEDRTSTSKTIEEMVMAREKDRPESSKAEEEIPQDVYTPARGNILAMMEQGGRRIERHEDRLHGEAIAEDHAVAASLPVEHSAIDETGHMDHHRKPIISVHGKDIDEHELDHISAA